METQPTRYMGIETSFCCGTLWDYVGHNLLAIWVLKPITSGFINHKFGHNLLAIWVLKRPMGQHLNDNQCDTTYSLYGY